MKIWLDPALLQWLTMGSREAWDRDGRLYEYNREGCDEGCKEPPEEYAPDLHGKAGDDILEIFSTALSQTDVQDLPAVVLWRTDPLYVQTLSPECVLVCHPAGAGHMALLDMDAFRLLEQFRMPTPLEEARNCLADCPPARLLAGVALFYKLGFLQSAETPHAGSPRDTSGTLGAWLHITNACNLRCPYCYLDKTSEHMVDDTARKAVDAVFRSAIKHHYRRVRLQYAGGEASIHAARVVAIHDYATTLAQEHALDLYAYIMSNGVFLAQHSIDQFKQRAISVMISLDGIGAYHDSQRPFMNGRGSFKCVDRTIDRLLMSGLIPHISVTVSRRNLPGLPELVTYILERDLPFSLNYYRDNECSTHIRDLQFEEGQMIEAMRAVFALIERRLPRRRLLGSLIDKANLLAPHRYTCGMGRSYMVIDQRGGIARCHADIKRTVTTIAADDPLLFIRKARDGVQAYAVDEKEGCRSCQWRYWCAGGCPLLTYRVSGRSDVRSPNCAIYQALFPDVLRLEALRLLEYAAPLSF